MAKPSKVIYGGKTIIDLTQDTVKPEHVLVGYTAHGADGETFEGACPYDADTQDATAADSEILEGKSAYVRGVKKSGTMKNNESVIGVISTRDEEYRVPQGYHDGGGKVGISTEEKQKLISENVREGVTILGVEGSMSGTEDAIPQAKTVTPSTSQQIVLPDAGSGYNYLSQVTVSAIPYAESDNNAGGKTVTIA